MSGFVIFALVLTFVYVVYFAVMITLDLHGKKDEKKSEEETYDVGDMTNEEQPVAIEERNDNPDEGDMTFTEQITDDGLRVVNPICSQQNYYVLLSILVYYSHSTTPQCHLTFRTFLYERNVFPALQL